MCKPEPIKKGDRARVIHRVAGELVGKVLKVSGRTVLIDLPEYGPQMVSLERVSKAE